MRLLKFPALLSMQISSLENWVKNVNTMRTLAAASHSIMTLNKMGHFGKSASAERDWNENACIWSGQTEVSGAQWRPACVCSCL